MAESYTKRNPDGTRSVYYPDAQKKYKDKYNKQTKQYNVRFGLSELDIAEELDQLISNSGMGANSYIKNILIQHVKEHSE